MNGFDGERERKMKREIEDKRENDKKVKGGREREKEKEKKVKASTPETIASKRSVFFVRCIRFFAAFHCAQPFSAIIMQLIIYSTDKTDRQASNAMMATDIYASFPQNAQII